MAPLEHVVLFKLKVDVAEEKKEGLMRSLLSLRDVIPGILQVSAGVNFSARAQGYTHGFVARFQDRVALDHYISHPAHVAVVEKQVKPICESVLALDYDLIS
ncbi:MAG: Dabb family protein [Elusimicrobia bacterium]|jgi:hypothetical protein|nr:Dabb family protein [Elusimicrobiota bacterium]